MNVCTIVVPLFWTALIAHSSFCIAVLLHSRCTQLLEYLSMGGTKWLLSVSVAKIALPLFTLNEYRKHILIDVFIFVFLSQVAFRRNNVRAALTVEVMCKKRNLLCASTTQRGRFLFPILLNETILLLTSYPFVQLQRKMHQQSTCWLSVPRVYCIQGSLFGLPCVSRESAHVHSRTVYATRLTNFHYCCCWVWSAEHTR